VKRIIKQGYVPPKYKNTCSKCGCIFIFDGDEIEKEEIMFRETFYVTCPWCANKISESEWTLNDEEGSI
jgi:hypothetical protein